MGETVLALSKIDERLNAERLLKQFQEVAKAHTLQADVQFDEDGKPIKEAIDDGFDDSVVIVEENMATPEGDDEVAALIEGVEDDDPGAGAGAGGGGGARNRKRGSKRTAKKARGAARSKPVGDEREADQGELFED